MTGRPLCWHQRGQSPHKGNLGSRQPDLDRDSSAARPAPWQSFLLVMSSSTLHKPSSSFSSTTKVLPQKVRRNERERKRVHQVNLGFNRLRERVPNPSAASKKLSKVETLREAAKYIRRLQEVLVQTESFSHSPSFPPHSTPSCYSQASIIQSPPFNRYSFYSSPQLKTESPSSASSSTSFYSEPSLDESRMQFGQ